jgi:hypothetical protein
MTMTLTEIGAAVQAEMRVNATGAIFGDTSDDALLVQRYANACGSDLALARNWQALRREHTFTGVSGTAQAGGYPSDFGRLVPETFYIGGALIHGPVPASDFANFSQNTGVSVPRRFTRRGNSMLVYPALAGGEACSYEYITTHWCEDENGTGKARMTFDTDVPRLDAELLIACICVAWLASSELPFGWAQARFQKRMELLTEAEDCEPALMVADAALSRHSGRRLTASSRHYDGVPGTQGLYD